MRICQVEAGLSTCRTSSYPEADLNAHLPSRGGAGAYAGLVAARGVFIFRIIWTEMTCGLKHMPDVWLPRGGFGFE